MSVITAGGGFGKIFILFLIIGLVLLALVALAMPTQAPDVRKIKYRPHAVERHGADAITARQQVEDCGFTRLRSKFCLKGDKITVVYWCETGKTLCPGMYVTIGGIEKTSFFQACERWRKCK